MASFRPVKGFTLIELVCTIVILGILAATAVPRFSDLGKDARIAKLNMLAGALHTTASLWNAVCLLQKTNKCLVDEVDILHNGTSANIIHGYPNAGDARPNQIESLINTSGFDVTKPKLTYVVFAIADAPRSTRCAVSYCESNNVTEDPEYCTPTSYRIVTLTEGC